MTGFAFDIVGFDLDGTLLNTLGDLAEAVNYAIALEGRAAIQTSHVRRLVGGGSKLMLHRALDETGGPVSEARFSELSDILVDYYAQHIAVHTQPYPGGEAMLDGLAARGVRLALVTNKLERLAVSLLDELGLSDRFYTIIGGDTLGHDRAKPKPDLLNLMLSRTAPGRAAYVGDTTFDTGAARAAGLPCVAVSFGFNDLPAHELGANATIDHFDELIPTLERL